MRTYWSVLRLIDGLDQIQSQRHGRPSVMQRPAFRQETVSRGETSAQRLHPAFWITGSDAPSDASVDQSGVRA